MFVFEIPENIWKPARKGVNSYTFNKGVNSHIFNIMQKYRINEIKGNW